MSGHGPDAATFDKALAADTTQPQHVTDTMAFMFESRFVLRPTRSALHGKPSLQQDYMQCWLGLDKRFDPSRA
jgi:homogentisate 1,2-dioxygenase